MLDSICTSGKQSEFFSMMSLPISFFPMHFDIFLLIILKVETRKIYLFQQKALVLLGMLKKL